ncbi:MAG TPA: hypothetical protein VGI71_17940 [Scandinavium sp.]|jgi:hypothetical protein
MQLCDFHKRQQVSPGIRKRAVRMLEALRLGKKVFRRLDANGYLKMDLGPHWRILSKDGGKQWWLMNHETYNREIRK